MKKILSIVLCVVFILSLSIPASAALEYTYIDTIYSSLEFNEFWGVANCSASADCFDGNDIEIEVTLQMEGDSGWENLKTWTSTGNYSADAGGQYAVARGHWYRLYITVYIFNDAGRIVESGTQINEKYF